MASKNSVPFQVHYKVDPAILTFVNPVSAFHASEKFISWTQNEGAKHKIYNINAPKPPILIYNNGNFNSTLVSYGYRNNGSSNRVWTANGQVTIYYGFGGSRIYNNEPILVYDNVKTIKCSYKSYNLENSSSGTTDPYGTARAIIRLNKKEKGFEIFEGWTDSAQVSNGIPLSWGGGKTIRFYWTPSLETEWLDPEQYTPPPQESLDNPPE